MTDRAATSDDTYPNAGRDSGYVAPVGENLVNVVTGLLAAIETKLLLGNQELAAAIASTTQLQDQRFQYILNQLSAFLDKEDSRHDTYSGELQAIVRQFMGLHEDVQQVLIVSKESTARLGKIDRDLRSVALRLDTLDVGQARHSTQLDELAARITADEERLDRKRETIADHDQRIRALEERNERISALEAALAQLAAERGG